MKLTKDDFGEADSVWMIIKKDLSQFDEIRDQILKNQEHAEKYREIKQRLDKYGEVQLIDNLQETDSILARRQKNQDYVERVGETHIEEIGENKVVVHRLKKRIGELKKLLENKDLTNEQSMELQYWLRENTMALGEKSQRLTSTEEGRRALADFEAGA